MSGYYNGGDDDGLTVGMTEFARRLDDARGEFVESGEPFGVDSVSPVVRALTAALAGVDVSPVPPVAETPVQARSGAREPGWSAQRGRRA
ncbi:hypothetical protein ACFPH6_19560 [Streptomyces xiangluensis]|uniref:Uncharacterized protein n=1 Tax=Streptomyces xiangluensis TaxID=2665720 RepID=A0ABV8YS68_9ACTN